MGRRLYDVVWVSSVPLVSQNVVRLLGDAGITGWGLYPVDLRDRDNKSVGGYFGLMILGRCHTMSLDVGHSRVVYEDFPRGRAPFYQGLFVSVETWDGSDIFVSADGKTAHIVVTKRVKEVLESAGVKNVRLDPISEVRVYATDLPSL
jgi:hypothetical protein